MNFPENPARTAAFERQKNLVGHKLAELDTPALAVDAEAINRNMQRMVEFAQRHNVRVRPHIGAHKNGDIARLQQQAGAAGICTHSLWEAETMAARGLKDILITGKIVGTGKLRRVAALAHQLASQGGKLAVTVDSVVGVEALASAMTLTGRSVDVFIDIDLGQRSGGVAVGEKLIETAQAITAKASRMNFAGLNAYCARAQRLRSTTDRRTAVAEAARRITLARELLREAEITVPLITGAGTGTFGQEVASGLWGEVQAGSFVLMDADYLQNERDAAQPAFEPAVYLKATVVSAHADYVIIDAGHQSHAMDASVPQVVTQEGETVLIYEDGGQGYGVLRAAAEEKGALPEVGATVWLIPGHCEATVNLHDLMYAFKGKLSDGTIEAVLRVDARGGIA